MGQPTGSPTQVARTFNQNFSGQPVSAQTVRKWLLAEAVPTQPKLLALAAWLGVSAMCSSTVLLAELLDVLSREKFAARLARAGLTPWSIASPNEALEFIKAE